MRTRQGKGTQPTTETADAETVTGFSLHKARLCVNNSTKRHALAVDLPNGQLAIIPVDVQDAEHTAASYTAVAE